MLKSITSTYRGIDYTIATSCSLPEPRTFINGEEVKVSYTEGDLISIADALKARIDEILEEKEASNSKSL